MSRLLYRLSYATSFFRFLTISTLPIPVNARTRGYHTRLNRRARSTNVMFQ